MSDSADQPEHPSPPLTEQQPTEQHGGESADELSVEASAYDEVQSEVVAQPEEPTEDSVQNVDTSFESISAENQSITEQVNVADQPSTSSVSLSNGSGPSSSRRLPFHARALGPNLDPAVREIDEAIAAQNLPQDVVSVSQRRRVALDALLLANAPQAEPPAAALDADDEMEVYIDGPELDMYEESDSEPEVFPEMEEAEMVGGCSNLVQQTLRYDANCCSQLVVFILDATEC